MNLRRLRTGEWLVGIAGLVLLVALFLPWYTGDAASRTGWQALGALDVVLAIVALSALAVPVVTAFQRVPAVPLAHEALTTLAGMVAVVLVLVRVLNMPDWAVERDWGLWVALAATLAVVAAGLTAMRDERLGRAGHHTDLSGAPIAQQPEIETLPPPRAEAQP